VVVAALGLFACGVRFGTAAHCDDDRQCPRQAFCSEQLCLPCPLACSVDEICHAGACARVELADAGGGPDAGSPALFCDQVEAEAGQIAAPMHSVTNDLASGGQVVTTDTDGAGSVNFYFHLTQAGRYAVQVRALTDPPVGGYCDDSSGACNSFFVGMDGEAALGDETHGFMLAVSSSYFWQLVNEAGSSIGPTPPEFDPMTWDLTPGLHVVTFYGREQKTWLDVVALRQCPAAGCAQLSGEGCALGGDH
jgi:hypothetical protein